METIQTIPPTPPPKPSSRTPLGLFRKWSRSSERVKDTAPSIHDGFDDHYGDDVHSIDPETQEVEIPPSRPPKDSQTRSRNPLRLFRSKSREKHEDPVFTETHRDSSGAPVFADSPTGMEAPILPTAAPPSKGRNPLALFRKKSREPRPEGVEESTAFSELPGRVERALDITWSGEPAQPSRPTGEPRGLNPLRLFRTRSREQGTATADAPEDEADPTLAAGNVEEAVNPLVRTQSRGKNPFRLFRSKSKEQEPQESRQGEMLDDPQHDEDGFEHSEDADRPLTRKGSLRRNLFGGLFGSKSPEEDVPDSIRHGGSDRGSVLAQDQPEHFEEPIKPRTRKGSLGHIPFGGLFRSKSREKDTAPMADAAREDEEPTTYGDQSRVEHSDNVEEEEIPSRSTRFRGLKPLGLFRSKSREHDVAPMDDDMQGDEGPRIDGDQTRFEEVGDVDEPREQTHPTRSRGINPFGLFRSKTGETDPAFADDSRSAEVPKSAEEVENLEDPVNPLRRKRSGGRYPFGIFKFKSRGRDPAGMDTSEMYRAGDGSLHSEEPARVEYVGSVEGLTNTPPGPSRRRKPLGLIESSPRTREQEYSGGVDDMGPKLAEDQVENISNTEEHANSQPSPASLVESPWYGERSDALPVSEEQPRFGEIHEPVDSRAPLEKKKRRFGLFRSKSRDQEPPEEGMRAELEYGPDHADEAAKLPRPKKKGSFGLFRSKSRDQDLPVIPPDNEEGEGIYPDDGSRLDHPGEAARPLRPEKKRSFGLFRSKSRDQGVPESLRGDEGGGSPPPAAIQAEYADRGEGAASPLRRKPSRGFSLGLFKSRSRDTDTRSVLGDRQTEGSIKTLEDVHADEAIDPLRPKRSLSLNPLRLFRTRSRDQEIGSLRSQQLSGEGGSMMSPDAASGRGSPYTQPQGRTPFRLFRKKSRGDASIPEADVAGDGTVHFADGPSQGSLPLAKGKKGGWRSILKRRKVS